MAQEIGIEEGLENYLQNHPVVGPLLKRQIYFSRVPTDVKMPWCVFSNAGGGRTRITQKYTEARDTLTLFVDDSEKWRGKRIMREVVRALENFRGDMVGDDGETGAYDLYVKCGTPRDLQGWQGSYRYILALYARYKFVNIAP